MKHATRVLALALALMLVLSLPALAEEDTVLVTYDGQPITRTEVQSALDNLIANGYVFDDPDYATAIEYLIQDRVIQDQIKAQGLDQFTDEEMEAFRAEAAHEWEDALDAYVSYFLAEDTEEARTQAREDAVAYYTAYGYTEETALNNLKIAASYDKLEERIRADANITVTEEEIRQVFEEYAKQDQEMYEGNVSLYEMYKTYYGAESWYMPEGYRGIIHILLSVDDEVMAAYESAQALYEESKTEESPDGDAVLHAAAEEALQAVLASKQDVIDEIYARLVNGESFESLIAEYGEDPGMENAATVQEGYAVHPESNWDQAFITGAFSEKMQKPGDVSDPVVGSYGIHILYYLRDIPGGIVEMNDEISAEIEEFLSNQKISEIYSDLFAQWATQHEIVYNQEAIDALGAAPAELPEE